MQCFSCTKLVSLKKKKKVISINTPPPNKQANQRTLPFCVSQCHRASLSQLPQRRRQRCWCLSPAAPRHVVYSISSPHLWYLNHKGEHFISLLGEEGWSCLSERTCWIKGVISPEGGYESECHSQSTQSCSPSARCQGAQLWLFPLPLLHHAFPLLIFSFLCLLPLLHHCYHLVTLPSSFYCSCSAALQGLENCVVRRMVVIPITPLMQRGSSKVQNNWQVPPASGRLSIPVCACVCV